MAFRCACNTTTEQRLIQMIHFNNQRVIYKEIVIDVKAGVGNVNDTDPIIQLRYSDDGTNTWSSWIDRDLGATGEYTTRVKFNNLGMSRNRIFEFRCTDKVEFQVVDAFANVEVLND